MRDIELGDSRPSQFLQHLQTVVGGKINDPSFLQQLFVGKLLPTVQVVLAPARAADLADKIAEAYAVPSTVSAVQRSVSSSHC